MVKSKYFLLFMICFLGGIFVGEFWLNQDFLKIFVVFGLGMWGIVQMVRSFKLNFWKILVFVIIAVGFGVFRFFISFESGDQHIQNYEGYVEFKGCVVGEVDVRNDKVKYSVEAEKILIGNVWQEVFGKVLVNAERYPVYDYGDCFSVKGILQKPEMIEDFTYDRYLARYGIYAVMYRAELEKISGGGGSVFLSWIYDLKGVFEVRLRRVFAEPHGSFMAGLLLGSRKGIPEHLMQSFNTTGLTHIIAISGYNITLVIVVISGLFGFLSRRWKVFACSFFIIIFVIMVGASAAVVRAAIMGVISLIALFFGRQYFVIIGLFGAAFFMNLWNPKILVYDIGFQLSFLATFGIVVFADRIERYFRWMPSFFGMREAVLMTLSAQILALPVIILNFGRLSVVSPIANVFVLPLIPLAMLFGFFAVLFGRFFGFLGYLILEFIIFVVNVFASINFASVSIEWFSWWMLVLYFLFFVYKYLADVVFFRD